MVDKGLIAAAAGFVLGVGLLVAGAFWIYPPAGLICAGVLVLAAVVALFVIEV